jgi:hypothetical protein
MIAWFKKQWERFRYVVKTGDSPYLIRYRLLKTPWFGIYLHHILRSDLDRCLHDHPFCFWSLVLWGRYTEFRPREFTSSELNEISLGAVKAVHELSQLQDRQAELLQMGTDPGEFAAAVTYLERIIEVSKQAMAGVPIRPMGDRKIPRRWLSLVYRKATDLHRIELDKPCWTLFIRGPSCREWGFLTDDGWVDWRKYHELPKPAAE